MMMIITNILIMLRNGFVLSKTVIFIFGLLLSHVLANKAVVDVFADFLGDNKYDLWKATMLVNVLDGLSDVLKVAVIHVSEVCTGRFKAIIFCTAAYTTGLVLLWVRASAPDMVTVIFAVLVIAVGTASKGQTLREFFDHQLSEEKVKKKCAQKNEGEDKESSEEEKDKDKDDRSGNTNLWWPTASIIGFVIAVCLSGLDWWPIFAISSSTMAATCLLFIIGVFWVFKTAINKRRLSYPSSKQGYNHGDSNDLSEDDLFYRTENGALHLLPRHPSFLSFLDKAAIKNGNEEDVCRVVQVRDVKSLYLIIPLGVTMFAYSLVSASGNTYFVLQATNLSSFSVGVFNVPIMMFFAMKSLATSVARTTRSRYELVRPLWSVAVGMFCSVLCCIAAWQVERRRLFLIKFLKNPHDDVSLSIMILTPQYFLLGLMEGFAEGGLKTFLRDRMHSESMKKFVKPCIEMLLGIGKFSSILFALIFHKWIKDDINDSHLDWYFLMLASMSFAYLMIYGFYVKFKLQKLIVSVSES